MNKIHKSTEYLRFLIVLLCRSACLESSGPCLDRSLVTLCVPEPAYPAGTVWIIL